MKLAAVNVFMKIKLSLIGLLLCVIAVSSQAQTEIPTGSWRYHLVQTEGLSLAQTATHIYCLTRQGIISYSLAEQQVKSLSKLNGLSANNASAIAANDTQLIVGYPSGTIDLVNDRVTRISTLAQLNTAESKFIRDIEVSGQIAYVATDLGVILLDLQEKIISDSYRQLSNTGENLPISGLSLHGTKLYLASPEGLLIGDLNDNLRDFATWQRNELPSGLAAADIQVIDEEHVLISDVQGTLFLWSEMSFEAISLPADVIYQIKKLDENGLVFTDWGQFSVTQSGEFSLISDDADLRDFLTTNSTIYQADAILGLTVLQNDQKIDKRPNGPERIPNRVRFANGTTYALGSDRISRFSEGRWTNDVSEFILNDVAYIANGQTTYFITPSQGIIASSGASTLLIDQNTPEVSFSATADGLLFSEILTNANGELVIYQNNTPLGLHILNAETGWRAPLGGTALRPLDMTASIANDYWLGTESGLYIWRESPSVFRRLSTQNTILTSNRIQALDQDSQQNLWIGTDKGLYILPFAVDIQTNRSLEIIRPIFDGRILFQEENITSLLIDPADQIWVGTAQNGLWLFANNGSELISQFTTSNSPLPSNEILDLSLQPTTGELFILTPQGLVSYRGQATEPSASQANVKIFPNPATPGQPINITQTTENALIKITTASGRLVRELNSLGGSILWDQLDYRGQPVSTGVYLVFLSDALGVEKNVGKIIIR